MALLSILIAACPSGETVGGLDPIPTGSLAVDVQGLPDGTVAQVSVSNTQGFQKSLTGDETVAGLKPGVYSISALDVILDGDRYSPAPSTQNAIVNSGSAPSTAAVAYALASGRLTVTVVGLPSGVSASVLVSGPGGYLHVLSSSGTLAGLVPGAYIVAASNVIAGGGTYLPTEINQSATVVVGTVPQATTVTYSQGFGSLSVTVTGLPAGNQADVTVTGPAGFTQSLTGSQILSSLMPGSYTVTAAGVTAAGTPYTAVPATQSSTVTVGVTASATVNYTGSTGGLTVTIAGLPPGINANVTVTGPGSFNQTLATTQTYTGLLAGTYTITAVQVSSGGTSYTPAPGTQVVAVVGSATANAAVSYTGGVSASLNLTVDGVYLTQATQRYDGTVPLVAGRNAYLRVFPLANQANAMSPSVRVRLYNGTTLVQTYTIPAPAAGVPTSVNESSLANSWNVMVPGNLVQPNLKVLADVDPPGMIAESSELDNQFPVSGTPGAVDVRTLPVFQVRFVPVLQQVNSLQGGVNAGNAETFLKDLKQQLPVNTYSADVRAPFTTSAAELTHDNANDSWGVILNELLALKSSDASTRYYYGVVKVSYTSGVAGLGYVGGTAHTAMGWDFLPGASGVMAHEVGHNFSRTHAPCGGVAGPDPSFPYAGGKIGVWGLDVSTLALKSPASFTDLMGYCSPTWISDYNWTGMVSYRQQGPANLQASVAAAAPGLLVWGRITPSGVVLEPSFTLASAGGRAPVAGPHRLDLLAADGSVLRTVAFAADTVADLPGGPQYHFAFVIPLDGGIAQTLAGLRVRSPGRADTRLASVEGQDPSLALSRPNPEQIEVRWDVTRYPMVMVRDAATGDILSFARGGAARLWSRSTDFTFQFSNGVRSTIRQGRILR